MAHRQDICNFSDRCPESVLLTSTIDAKEGRDMAIIDIPNAFVTTRIEEKKTLSPSDSEGNWLN